MFLFKHCSTNRCDEAIAHTSNHLYVFRLFAAVPQRLAQEADALLHGFITDHNVLPDFIEQLICRYYSRRMPNKR